MATAVRRELRENENLRTAYLSDANGKQGMNQLAELTVT